MTTATRDPEIVETRAYGVGLPSRFWRRPHHRVPEITLGFEIS
jgi:hypothetical protein